MKGAGQELYELVSFPAVLHGETFKVAAGFIFDHCGAVLLALEGTKGTERHHLDVADIEQVGVDDAVVVHSCMLDKLVAGPDGT